MRSGALRRVAIVVIAAVCAAGCSSAGGSSRSAQSAGCDVDPVARASNIHAGEHDFDGEQRTFNLAVPARPGPDPAPLVVNLHGGLSDADTQDALSRLPDRATDAGAVVLSPQASAQRRVWSLVEPTDVAFVADLVERIGRIQCIDRTRVHLVGFSMGGMLAMRIACGGGDAYRSVISVAGTLPIESCDSEAGLLAVHGTADPVVRFDGHLDGLLALQLGNPVTAAVPDVVDAWAARSGCTGRPTVEELAPAVTATIHTCPGEPVELVVIDGGTHVWPSGASADGIDDRFDATAAVLERVRAG